MGLLLHVLGTDTGVGKTVLTAGLARALRAREVAIGVVKPFATGAGADGAGEDAAVLAAALGEADPRALTEWTAPEPLAPLVAAERAGRPVPVDAVAAAVRARAASVDVLLVEGIGGVRTPLAPGVSYLDFAGGLGGSAVVASRPQLGTLNHSRLTVDACRGAGLRVLGLVCCDTGVRVAGDVSVDSNAGALAQTVAAPLWPPVPYLGPALPDPLPVDAFAPHAERIAAALAGGGADGALPLAHELETRVRYGETDQMGMVYHGDYFQYFDMGRTELLRAQGLPYAELERRGALLTVTAASCKYIAPARYDDRLRVRTELIGVRRVRLEFRYAIHRVSDGAHLAEGATTLACIGRDGRPRRLPQELLRLLPDGDAA